jgi:serine/threonine protein kinase
MTYERLAAELADRYRLERELGRGGMAVVFLAQDVKHSRQVAVKVLHAEFGGTAFAERFFREIGIAARLAHPNILPLHDSGQAAGRLFYVTPYLEGESLRGWLERERCLPLEVAIGLAGEIADALDYAHRHAVIHRDIKPDNILIADGHAIVADFGIATALAADDARLTSSGLVLGTPRYMSPEQALAGQIDGRSDVYSLACVLYECLVGEPPSAGSTGGFPASLGPKSVARRLQAAQPSAPRHVVEAIQRGLSPDPGDRHPRASDFRRALLADSRARIRNRWWITAGAGTAVLLAAGLMLFRSRASTPAGLEYTPLTNFAESATSPALSPDGRMLAFIRGQSTFSGPGQIYVKILPDGEPVQLTKDDRVKRSPKFSPDGTRIGYSAVDDPGVVLDTWVVPVLGGQPRLLLSNAEGLTWITDRNPGPVSPPSVLFSQMTGRGYQKSIVSSTESRTDPRTVYLPPTNGMAHRSSLSPDGKQLLVVEMGSTGEQGGYGWLPCRLIPFDGSSSGKSVGPAPAQCTDAAWSPDGKWMYFSTNTGGGFHIWRQRFPDGTPAQVTFGATEEEGIHFAPDGRSFVTSIGSRQSTVWIHDASGDRQITSEGFAFFPTVSPDAKKLYYLVQAGGARNFVTGLLWVADLESGQHQRLLPDFQLQHYTISADGQRVVFVALDGAGRTPVWLAALNGRTAPRRLTTMDARAAFFGAPGEVVFAGEGDFVYRVKDDGSELQKIIPAPMLHLFGVSPDGRWVPAAEGAIPDKRNELVVYPTGGGLPTLICKCYPPQPIDIGPRPPYLSWTPDGRFLYLKFIASTYAIPLQPGQLLPPIPASGFQSKEAVAALPGARLISDERVFPGPNPSIYAFMKVAAQRNIYRVPVP